ncbi:MAG: hypothetical protein ABEJ06_00175 [Haloarculaceae archaeon]
MDHSHQPDRQPERRGALLNRRDVLAGGAAGIAGVLAGCANGDSSQEQTTELPGTLEASADSGVVGDPLQFRGSGLPGGTDLDLVWHSVDGHWGLVKETEIVAPQYPARADHVGTVATDSDGTFTYDWAFPEDYGGSHEVTVRSGDGTTLARTTVGIEPSFELDRTSAPLGETFTVTAHGLGVSGYTSEYEVAWDNGLLGIVTAVSSRGRAEAVVPAAGPVGEHVLRVGRGWSGVFYLNLQQSPYEPPDFPTWTVEVTEPADELSGGMEVAGGPPASPETMRRIVDAQYPDATVSGNGASLSVSPPRGSVGDRATVTGSGLPSNEGVDLVWLTKRGNRVQSGFSTSRVALASATTDGKGRFETQVTVPDDLGGVHPLVAEVGGSPVALATYGLDPSVAGISPASGPVGTDFTVHLKGVGWTEYDNTYAVAYDNKLLGYACGFNSQGDVKIPLTATGPAGYHTIDLYPAVYQGIDEGTMPDFYNKPQLSYRTDHPGRSLPAFRFVFETTES